MRATNDLIKEAFFLRMYFPNNSSRYLKDYDFYQRMLMERERSLDECSRKNRKRRARFVVSWPLLVTNGDIFSLDDN